MTLRYSKHNFFSSLVFRWLIVRNIIQDVLISDNKHRLPSSHGDYLGALGLTLNPGGFEAHPAAVEAHPGAVEAHPEAVEAHPGAVEVHPGAVEVPL
jgi:hypothetical protein